MQHQSPVRVDAAAAPLSSSESISRSPERLEMLCAWLHRANLSSWHGCNIHLSLKNLWMQSLDPVLQRKHWNSRQPCSQTPLPPHNLQRDFWVPCWQNMPHGLSKELNNQQALHEWSAWRWLQVGDFFWTLDIGMSGVTGVAWCKYQHIQI